MLDEAVLAKTHREILLEIRQAERIFIYSYLYYLFIVNCNYILSQKFAANFIMFSDNGIIIGNLIL